MATSSVSSTTSAGTYYSLTSSSSSSTTIDSSALIEAAVQAKLARATSIEDRIEVNSTRISAYQEMQSLLTAMQTSLGSLRNDIGYDTASDNAFNDRAAYLTASGTRAADDLLGATIADGAATGSYTVEVLQTAAANKIGSASQADRSADLGSSGTLSLGLEGGEAVSIDISADMSLDEVAAAINAKRETSGVGASVIKVAEGSYMLLLTATETGKAIQATDADGGVLQSLGVIDDDGTVANELQAARDAILRVDGVEIRRDSNEIDDVIDGMTLHLYAAEAGNVITVDVGNDLSAVKEAIMEFVEAYNAFRSFVSTNQKYDASSGGKSADAVLFGDNILRSTSSSLSSLITTAIDGLSLRDLGITLTASNQLQVDETTLDAMLLKDVDAVRRLFEFQTETSSSDLSILRRGASVPADFTLDVTVDADGTLTGATVNGESGLFTVSGNRLIGATGTVYEGYQFVFTGKSDASIDVGFSEGIAESIYRLIDTVAASDSSTLNTTMAQLEQSNEALSTRADTVREGAERYRTFLTEKYARMEAAIEAAKLVLAQLEAFMEASK